MIKKLISVAVIFSITLSLASCFPEEQKSQKNLLIYCGITMIRPMAEIAKIFEKKHDCKVVITKGGSGNLLKSIKTNMVGDLYLPGSETYIKEAVSSGLVAETAHVGFNKAAMMTLKGNPLNIPEDLSSLANSSYYVVIGNPKSGSIGRETKNILKKYGNFDQVIKNARQMTTDSKDLIRVIKDKEADLVINWFATSTWPENKDFVDVLPIDEKYAAKKKLVLGVLTVSKHHDLAKEFLDFAASDAGRKIFNKFGLYEIR
jgi:molybdate transport system substrate-binding protein